MEGYSTENEQLEEIKQWWNHNGKFVVTVLVIGALAVGGWRFWGYWQSRRAEQAAGLYDQVLAAENKNDVSKVTKAAKAVMAAYPNTAYATFSGLALAKVEVAQQDYGNAEQVLRKVVRNAPDAGMATVARLRLARVLVQADHARRALDVLARIDDKPFLAMTDLVRGNALDKLKEMGKAREAYEQALHATPSGSSLHAFLKLKLASLPVRSHGSQKADKVPSPHTRESATSGAF